MLVATPALVAGWALAGFYGSLGPALIGQLAGSDSLLLGGLALFTLAGTAALSVPLLRTTAPRVVMLVGPIALLLGVGLVLLATTVSAVALFFVGTAVAGVGFGAGFQGAVQTVTPLAAVDERAGVISVIYLVSYLAMGLPAIVAGVLVVHGGGVMSTAREYGAALMLLAALAALGLVWRRAEHTPATDGPTPLAGEPHLQAEVRCPAC
jgi:MFS family permease